MYSGNLIIACVEDPEVIERIPDHRKEEVASQLLSRMPAARAPQGRLG